MWERMYIKNNEKVVSWHEREHQGKPKKSRFIETLKTSCGLNSPPPTVPMLAAELASAHIPPNYGYHDFVSWQTADTTPNKPPAVIKTPSGQQNGGRVVAAKQQ
jgi:hypothetical protein